MLLWASKFAGLKSNVALKWVGEHLWGGGVTFILLAMVLAGTNISELVHLSEHQLLGIANIGHKVLSESAIIGCTRNNYYQGPSIFTF